MYNELQDYEDQFFIDLVQAANGKRDWYQFTSDSEEGKKGKSSFVKWLCYNYPLDIARISYGTASQLRSAVFNMGRRKCYIIDLPRTRGKSDSLTDILSVIEDVKNGFVTSSMYGGDKQLMMAPPTVIVFSNIRLPYNSLSEDRWDLYTINPDLKLVKSQHLYFGGEDFYQEDQLKERQVVSKTRSKRTRAKPKKEKA